MDIASQCPLTAETAQLVAERLSVAVTTRYTGVCQEVRKEHVKQPNK